MSAIDIHGVAHRFGALQALDGVQLSIAQGEFFSLLGPSGCGKTTLLNILAGFITPDDGQVLLGGRDVTLLPPHQREIGMVFQSYALFPHLTVFDNVAYGLRVRRQPERDIRARVEEMLALVRLSAQAQRMPHQLSGGQQQRVAMARALAIRPQVLLLDEPLSNLDAKLRKEMQTELRRLLGAVGVTTVMVTHDQEEALSMSDRIGILGGGHLQQVGTPLQLYRQPRNRFVAGFVGHANLIGARAADVSGVAAGLAAGSHFQASAHGSRPGVPLLLTSLVSQVSPVPAVPSVPAPAEALFLLRPERIRLALLQPADAQPSDVANSVSGVVRDSGYNGAELHLNVTLAGGGELLVAAPEADFIALPLPGSRVQLSWDAADLTLLPTGTDGLA